MKGSYFISIQNNKVRYEFTIRRNITIIQGDSATGKTTLVDLIREHQLEGSDSGINMSCPKKCVVLEGQEWEQNLTLYKDSIVFIDEGNRFIATPEFARAIKNSDNYYVIVTRESLDNLPYSVNEIYGIHTSGKYADLKQVYHEFYYIYETNENKTYYKEDSNSEIIDRIICEDSNAGYEFWSKLFSDKTNCETAKGKSNIYRNILNNKENTLIIADGAAFGSQMAKIMEIAAIRHNIGLFLPESFEYVLLKSLFGSDTEVKSILAQPENYIESKEYFSWEQYWTSLLVKKTDKTYLQYSKKELNKNYLSDKNKNEIIKSNILNGVLQFIQ